MEGSQGFSNPKMQGSWVSVVQNKQVLKKYDLDLSTSEGKKSVEVPDEVFNNATPLWEDFLVGRFLDTAPHVAKVHVILNKIWKQGTGAQQIDVYEVNSTTLRFRVRDQYVRARILRRGMWNIADVPMVVSKWSPNTEKDQPEEKSIPLWVYLKKVPMNMYSWEGLSFITSAVGHPVRLHPETAACSSFEVAKVFVNADLSKDLPKDILFSKNGTDFCVEFSYPWLPPRCSICEKWGHLTSRCVANMKNSATPSMQNEEEDLKQGTLEATPASDILLEGTVSEQHTEKSVIISEINLPENGEETNVDDAGQWTTVSPSNPSRSPEKKSELLGHEVSIVSASPFAVLSIPEDGEIMETTEEVIVGDGDDKESVQPTTVIVETGAVERVRPLSTHSSKKKQKSNSEISTHITKDTVPVMSRKKLPNRNF